jgi:hypothetical protein
MSNEADVDRGEVHVRPFDPATPDAPIAGPAIRVSKGRGPSACSPGVRMARAPSGASV